MLPNAMLQNYMNVSGLYSRHDATNTKFAAYELKRQNYTTNKYTRPQTYLGLLAKVMRGPVGLFAKVGALLTLALWYAVVFPNNT